MTEDVEKKYPQPYFLYFFARFSWEKHSRKTSWPLKRWQWDKKNDRNKIENILFWKIYVLENICRALIVTYFLEKEMILVIKYFGKVELIVKVGLQVLTLLFAHSLITTII